MLELFKIFPFFASDYFYILIITIGYLRSSNKRPFIDLGFLVPFSTIINWTLKSIFNIPRPDISTHLIPVTDMLGFPSGDVQVATIFWALLALNYKSRNLQILSLTMISLISISRVYLGVHSIVDVIGGIGIGTLIVIIWRNPQVINVMNSWINGNTKRLWILIVFSYLLFFTISKYDHMPIASTMSFGSLIGFAIFLSYFNPTSNVNNWTSTILSVVLLIVGAKAIPVFPYNTLTSFLSIIAKYSLISFSVYVLLPRIKIK